MDFIKFVFGCFSEALGYMVGDVNTSHDAFSKGLHGALSGLLFVVVSFLLVKFYCLDFEGYPKRKGCILLAIMCAIAIALIYLVIVYLFYKTG